MPHRNPDGSGTLVGPVRVAPPDASQLPRGEDCDPGWQPLALKASVNTPHFIRHFSHCCDDGCTYAADVVELSPEGVAVPTAEVPTYALRS